VTQPSTELKGHGTGVNMTKNNGPIYFRYEFSDETGLPEGGDTFKYATLAEVQDMAGKILEVAESDGVTVNFTIGTEGPFFGFLENVGLSRKDAEKEIVEPEKSAKSGKSSGTAKASKKKTSKKAVSKKTAKAKPKAKAKSKKSK
jgi:hypothetical protein